MPLFDIFSSVSTSCTGVRKWAAEPSGSIWGRKPSGSTWGSRRSGTRGRVSGRRSKHFFKVHLWLKFEYFHFLKIVSWWKSFRRAREADGIHGQPPGDGLRCVGHEGDEERLSPASGLRSRLSGDECLHQGQLFSFIELFFVTEIFLPKVGWYHHHGGCLHKKSVCVKINFCSWSF